MYKNVDRALNNIAHAIKPGGFFISLEPTNNNILTKFIRSITYRANDLFDEETKHAFTTKELDILCGTNGLEKVYQFYPGLISYILWYNPDAFPLLNIGNPTLVKKVISVEKNFWTSPVAKYFSFATFTCYTKLTENIP